MLCFHRMKQRRFMAASVVPPNSHKRAVIFQISVIMVMLLSLLRSATSLTQIHQIHAQILIHGLPLQTHLISKLIDLHSLDYARAVLDQTSSSSDFSWNSLIRAYTIHGSPRNSLFLYLKMLQSSAKPSTLLRTLLS